MHDSPHAPYQPRQERFPPWRQSLLCLLGFSESLIEQREQLTEAIGRVADGRRIQPLQRLAKPRMLSCAVDDVIGLDRGITCDCFYVACSTMS